MQSRFPELVEACHKRLKFHEIKPEKKVAILANTESFKPGVDAMYAAVKSLGIEPTLLVIPHRYPFSDIPDFTKEALCHVDFLIDMQHLTWIYTQSHAEVTLAIAENNGEFIVGPGRPEDVDTYTAYVPSQKTVERAQKAKKIIDSAENIRVTSKLGTDLHVERGNPEEYVSYTSGTFGQVAFAQPSGGANGVIEFKGYVRIQAPRRDRFAVRLPIRMNIEDGRIVEIDRSTSKGAYLDDWFKSFDSKEVYNFAHINLGLIPVSPRNIDNEAVHFAYGGVLIGFGRRGTPLFGTEVDDLPNHIDMHLRPATYYADDLCILKDGEFTLESGLKFEEEEL